MAGTVGNDQASPQLRAAIFSRESKGRSKSIADQLRMNEAAAADLNADVLYRLSDKVGASRFTRKDRVGWPEVIDLVTADKLDLLVVFEISRSDRVMDTFVPFLTACRDHAVRIHVSGEDTTYDPRKAVDRKRLLDAGSDAELEAEKISTRTRKGTAGAALAGKGHGPAGYGFTRVYDVHDRRVFTQVPNDDAPVAAAIIERIARRDPLKAIAADLNAAGIPSPGGGKWTYVGVRELARNASYAGLRDHKGDLHKANWDGIVPVSTWRTAMAVLNEPDRKRSAPGAVKWLLSNVAVGACDAPVHARPGARDRYLCADGCVAVGVEELDEYILTLIARRLSRKDARDLFRSDDAEAKRAWDAVAAVQLELDDLEAQLKKGPDNGGISATLAAAVEPDIRRRLAEAEARAKASSSHGAALSLLGSGKATEKSIRARWQDLSVAGRRAVVGDLFKAIRIGPAMRRLTRHSSPEERALAAAERTAVDWA